MTHKTKAAMPGRLCHCTKLKHIQDSTLIDQVNTRNHSVSGCFSCRDCLRWRRLISPLAAAMRKPAVLSLDSLTPSINSKSSKGSLTDTCSDLLFLLPVAITESPHVWWCSVCLIKISNQVLTWCSPINILVVFTFLGLVSKNSEARQCANTNRASYQTVIRGNDHG